MQLQKEVKHNPKQTSCKIVCGHKKAIVKKDVKSKPRNGCDGRLIAQKFLITTIQVNLVPATLKIIQLRVQLR